MTPRGTKPIRLSAHARGYIESRGFTIDEVEKAIRGAPWGAAELGKFECRLEFPFERLWKGKAYRTKQVRPIFVDEQAEIVVVAVYTYYY